MVNLSTKKSGGLLLKIRDYMLGLGTGIVIGVFASQVTGKMDISRQQNLY